MNSASSTVSLCGGVVVVTGTGISGMRTPGSKSAQSGACISRSAADRMTEAPTSPESDSGEPDSSAPDRSEEHTSELQSLMRISYAVFCLKKKNKKVNHKTTTC